MTDRVLQVAAAAGAGQDLIQAIAINQGVSSATCGERGGGVRFVSLSCLAPAAVGSPPTGASDTSLGVPRLPMRVSARLGLQRLI